MNARILHALLQQPAVHVDKARELQPRLEEPASHDADLILDLALLPPRCRSAGRRLDQVVAAHLGESSVEPSLTADQQRVHSRTHVVVDAALTGTFVKREGFVVRVEHHLLRLPRIGTHERHSAMAQPNLGDLHNGGRAV